MAVCCADVYLQFIIHITAKAKIPTMGERERKIGRVHTHTHLFIKDNVLNKTQDVESQVTLFANMQTFSGDVSSVTYSICLHL
jgi:hypothetical protein